VLRSRRAASISTARCACCLFLQESAFLALVRVVDVNLDSLGWSGGNSTLEITWFDVPTVTLPRALMRSRHSAAMMALMGLDELIAKDVDDYVAIAVVLGRDAGRRAELRARIAARKHVLYDDAEAVAAFADALEAGVRERA
jgi:predicted O-linked N-acetylglucosamine transferase (SPINDLY family)